MKIGKKNENPDGKWYLANDRVAGFVEISITPGDQLQVENGVKTIVENTSKVFNYERSTRWVQSFIVN